MGDDGDPGDNEPVNLADIRGDDVLIDEIYKGRHGQADPDELIALFAWWVQDAGREGKWPPSACD